MNTVMSSPLMIGSFDTGWRAIVHRVRRIWEFSRSALSVRRHASFKSLGGLYGDGVQMGNVSAQ